MERQKKNHNTFINSAGCIVNEPIRIQACEPFPSSKNKQANIKTKPIA